LIATSLKATASPRAHALAVDASNLTKALVSAIQAGLASHDWEIDRENFGQDAPIEISIGTRGVRIYVAAGRTSGAGASHREADKVGKSIASQMGGAIPD
jgi:hypothetical protein